MRALILLAAAALLSGCAARAAYKVVTFPVRAVSKGVDWATTSQEESDRNRGRKLREQEEREGKAHREAERDARRAERRARNGDEDD